MDKVILLKTQLAEAALLAKKRTYPHDRLAVILLDNFVEIQLSSLMKGKFALDNPYYREKKYSVNQRKKILNNYDDLLRVCVSEKVIGAEDLRLLTFCHSVRNNLYHKGGEEILLTRIALAVLHDLILQYQPVWKSARMFTSWDGKTIDPYNKDKRQFLDGNSATAWEGFLKIHFVFLDKRLKKPVGLLTDFLLEKVQDAKEAYKFVKNDFSDFYPSTANWVFNDFVREFSFLTRQKHEIALIRENSDKAAGQLAYLKLQKNYRDAWRFKKEERLRKLILKIRSLAKLPVSECLEKYNSLKDEVFMLNEALGEAAIRLDGEIQMAIDRARGK